MKKAEDTKTVCASSIIISGMETSAISDGFFPSADIFIHGAPSLLAALRVIEHPPRLIVLNIL